MADFYGLEFVGGPDGTSFPPKKLDVRLVGGKKRRVRSTKPTATPIAVGDRMFLGKLPQGGSLRGITGVTDTTLATTTVSIGTTAVPNKYVNAKTLTAVDTPTALGPKASAFVADPVSADEDLWATFGTAALAAGTITAFDFEYSTSN